jgi:CheY-like chemotaxis protein
MKVLLVEDHAELAQVTCLLLKEIHGHEVEHAASAKAALAAAEQFEPDLVLLDLNLPDMDGYELAGHLRQRPRLQQTVFIALTGMGSAYDVHRAQAVGIDAHYSKPMDFEDLEDFEPSRRTR